MPIYEYRCESCGAHLEVVQKITDPPLEACRSCENGRLVKLISNTSFVLKGGGWYADGYGSSGGSKPAAEKPAATSKPEPAASASSASSASPTSSTSSASSSGPSGSTGGDTKAA